jgi:hypothetical protein
MINKFLDLTDTQKILFYSVTVSIIAQILCVYCMIEKKETFKFDKCFGYLIFSIIAYLFYYKMIIP